MLYVIQIAESDATVHSGIPSRDEYSDGAAPWRRRRNAANAHLAAGVSVGGKTGMAALGQGPGRRAEWFNHNELTNESFARVRTLAWAWPLARPGLRIRACA